VALRANDSPTAKHVSENLGQVEQVEANEGMSYGVNDMRDGVNLSRLQVTRPLVMQTEVTNLPNLTGFLRFGRNLPVVRFEDRYNDVRTVSAAFVDRTEPPLRHAMAGELVRIAHAEAKLRDRLEQEPAVEPPTPPAPSPKPSRRRSPKAPNGQDDLFGNPAPALDDIPTEEIIDVAEGGLPIDTWSAWKQLEDRQRGITSNLVQHGRGDGPRKTSRPA